MLPSAAEAGTIINRPLAIGLSQGLVGHWTFDGKDMNSATGTAYDISGNRNNGILTNGPKEVSGRIGQALEFDGVDDYVQVASSSVLDNLTKDITISSWVKRDRKNRDFIFFRSDTSQISLSLGFVGDNFVYFGTSASIYANVGDDTNWHHVLGVIKSGSARIYYDGVLVVTGAVPSLSAIGIIRIGVESPYSPGTQFDGIIDEVRLYNRALSTDEIKRLYNMGR